MSWWTKKELHPKTKSKFVVVFSNAFYLPNVKSLNKPAVEIETKEYRLLNHTFNYPGNAKWKPVTLKFVDMNGMGSQTEFFDTAAFLWQMLNNTGYAYPYLDNSAFAESHYRNVGTTESEGTEVKTPYIDSAGHHISTQIAFKDDPKTSFKESNTWRSITTPEKSSNIANSFGGGLGGRIDKLPAGVGRQKVTIYQISPGETPVITEAWHLVNPLVKSINWGDLSYDSEDLVEYELQIIYDWAVLDRNAIGKPVVVDEKPYQQFMKTLQNNKETIDEEFQEKAAEAAEDFVTELFTDGGYLEDDIEQLEEALRRTQQGLVDINNDGVISDYEQKLAEDGGLLETFLDEATETLGALEDIVVQQDEDLEAKREGMLMEQIEEWDKANLPEPLIQPVETQTITTGATRYVSSDDGELLAEKQATTEDPNEVKPVEKKKGIGNDIRKVVNEITSLPAKAFSAVLDPIFHPKKKKNEE